MPSLVKIEVDSARNLPIMSDGSTDAYVEITIGEERKRTKTIRKSQEPVWKEDFRFEIVDDSLLQDAPVELKVLDQDLYSSELIGSVFIDLNPLVMRSTEENDRNPMIRGYFPLFDTLMGIRGSLHVTIKLQFIGNDNPFQDSSAGVQFFTASSLHPRAFIIQDVIGFVVDLVVDDDPESSWQDYFRKSGHVAKTSNDSRQKVLYNLSSEVRRELGKKVLDMGGNAVLGFNIRFDLEGASLQKNEDHTLMWPVQPARELNRLTAELMSLDDEAYTANKSRWSKRSRDVVLKANPRRCYHNARHAS